MARAVGIVRQSRGREESLSPAEQRERIEDTCRRDGLSLVAVHEEIDVSGGTPLAKRKGLREAVRAVESGEADVVMVAYFDRLVRSLVVQAEVVQRVEEAGGRVLALDVGEVSGRTAAQWLSGTMLGAVSEYYRRSVGERSGEAQAMAVARGVRPWPDVPFGYRERGDGTLEPDPATAPAVLEAYRLRAANHPIRAIWEYLREHGFDGNYGTAQRLLGNPVYLGEIRFGKLHNPSAHEAIVPRDLWQAVQRIKVPRGPQPKSERLLARLGVLVCGGCGGKMGATMSGDGMGGKVPVYRCPGTTAKTCELRAQVSAPIAERVVVEQVKRQLADVEGRAAAEEDARGAEGAAEKAQADYSAAFRAFQGHEDEPAAVERLAQLRQARDDAVERAHQLGGLRSALTIYPARDWDDLSRDAQRAWIRALIERAIVGPGKGAGRITVVPRRK